MVLVILVCVLTSNHCEEQSPKILGLANGFLYT